MVYHFEDLLYLIMYYYISKLCHSQIPVCQQLNAYLFCLFKWESQSFFKNLLTLEIEATLNSWRPTSTTGSPCLFLVANFILFSPYFRHVHSFETLTPNLPALFTPCRKPCRNKGGLHTIF